MFSDLGTFGIRLANIIAIPVLVIGVSDGLSLVLHAAFNREDNIQRI